MHLLWLLHNSSARTADICKQLHIVIPTLYRYVKDQDTPLRANVPKAEVIEIA